MSVSVHSRFSLTFTEGTYIQADYTCGGVFCVCFFFYFFFSHSLLQIVLQILASFSFFIIIFLFLFVQDILCKRLFFYTLHYLSCFYVENIVFVLF